MNIDVDPDAWVNEAPELVENGFEGGIVYRRRKATPEEYRQNRIKRLEKEKQELKEKLKEVNLQLKWTKMK